MFSVAEALKLYEIKLSLKKKDLFEVEKNLNILCKMFFER